MLHSHAHSTFVRELSLSERVTASSQGLDDCGHLGGEVALDLLQRGQGILLVPIVITRTVKKMTSVLDMNAILDAIYAYSR